MDIGRLLVIFLFQGGGSIFLLLLSIIYIRNAGIKRNNVFFLIFCWLFIFAAWMNIIYAFIFDEPLVKVLYALAVMGLVVAPMALTFLSFNFLTSKLSLWLQIIIFAILLILVLLLLLNLGMSHLIINSTTEWIPEWDIVYFVWFISIFSAVALIDLIFMSRVYMELANEKSKKKWRNLMVGVMGATIGLMGIAVANIQPYDSSGRIFGNLMTGTVLIFGYILFRALSKFKQ